MATTVAELVKGIFLQDLDTGIKGMSDVIDYLSENNIQTTDNTTIKRNVDHDTNAFHLVDKYGDTTASSSANTSNLADRSYYEDTYDMAYSQQIQFVIPKDMLYRYTGVPAETLKAVGNTVSATTLDSIVEGLRPEFNKLVEKAKQKRRDEVTALLKGLGAGATASVLPLGEEAVDISSGRPNFFTYTNKLSAALDASEWKKCVNIFASNQKDVRNHDFKTSKPIILLHASDFSLAESIVLPNLSVNTNNRTAGNSLGQIQAIGVYGDSSHSDDYVALGENHTIHRVAFVSAGNQLTNGLDFRLYAKENGSLVIEVWDRSEMVVDSPIDIVKSIVA